MRDGQYILPAELVLLLAFVLVPAVICAVAAQAVYLHRKHVLASSPGRASLGLAATALLGSLAAVAVFVLAPASAGRLLGIKEVGFLGQHWPVWPLGFLSLGAAACVSTWWLLRSGKSAA
jgi:hypothetical protein